MDDKKQEMPLVFEQHALRRVWHKEQWYYSILDMLEVLAGVKNLRSYWYKLKTRVKSEGWEETLAQVEALPLRGSDGRLRPTDCAPRQTILRIIQSVPSPRAEPFRIWLAQVGEERFEEIENPESTLKRLRDTYRAQGYSDPWIDERIRNFQLRNALTDEWEERGAKVGFEFAILTDTIHKGTFDVSIQDHRSLKKLPKSANLRDHTTDVELALISLGEATTRALHVERDSQGFATLKKDAAEGGAAAGDARRAVEQRLGKPVLSPQNRLKQIEEATKPPKPGKQLEMFGEE